MKNAVQQAVGKPSELVSKLLPFVAARRGPDRIIRVGFCAEGERRRASIQQAESTTVLSKVMNAPLPVPVMVEPSAANMKENVFAVGSPVEIVEPRALIRDPTLNDGGLVAMLDVLSTRNRLRSELIEVFTASTSVPGTLTTGPTPLPNTVGSWAKVKEVPLRKSKKSPVPVTDPPVKDAKEAELVLVILAPSAILKTGGPSNTLIVVPDVTR
jgi:hypothetical protein